MKRSFLEELGLEKEVIDKIMKENGTDIESAKKDLNSKSDELKIANETIENLKKNASNAEELQKTIDNHKKSIEELNNKIKENDLKALETKKESILKEKLAKLNVKSAKAVKSLLTGLEFDGEKFTNFDEKIESLKNDEETKILFNQKQEEEKKVFKSTGAKIDSKDEDDYLKVAEAMGLNLKEK